MKTRHWILASTLALLAVALAQPAAAQNDSAIVQAAKQKSSEKKSGHVYTNDDFPDSQAPPDNNTASQGDASAMTDQGDGAKADVSGDKTDAKAGDKKADPKSADAAKAADDQKLKDLEGKLSDAKKGEQDLQRKLDTLQQKADSTQDQFRKNMYLDMISNQQITLSEFRREQESLTAQIEQEKNKSKDKTADQEDKASDQK
ncbi:MAG: hypothetical protein ROO76_00825 [Terriglobia bacterium]|jgi:hypothetical protein|nr:hypothetical protein [Terriglobia bacterium]